MRRTLEAKNLFTAALLDLIEAAAEDGYEPWGLVRSAEGIAWEAWISRLNAEQAAPENVDQKAS